MSARPVSPSVPFRRHADRVPPPALNPLQLLEFTRFLAAEIAAGAHQVAFDPDHRWHRRIYRDARVDVWLISWLAEQGTQLHDHGGSAGAFTVVQGELSEAIHHMSGRRRETLSEHRRPAGCAVAFDARRVHDVRNVRGEAAVSVHAYSPPLQAMTFYDLVHGRLTATSTVATDDPESAPAVSG